MILNFCFSVKVEINYGRLCVLEYIRIKSTEMCFLRKCLFLIWFCLICVKTICTVYIGNTRSNINSWAGYRARKLFLLFFFCLLYLSMCVLKVWSPCVSEMCCIYVFCYIALSHVCFLCNFCGDGSVYISSQTQYFTVACLDQTAMNSKKNLSLTARVTLLHAKNKKGC